MKLKLGYRPDEAAEVLGSKELFDECVAAGWLKPVVQRRRMTIYDGSAIARCWQQICGGKLPPPRPRLHPRRQGAKEAADV